MKTIHILLLIIILVAFGIILTTVFNTDTYSTFSEASEKEGVEVSVIGKPVLKGKADSLRGIFPLTFLMEDNSGKSMIVVYQGLMPRDFEKLDQVIAIGMVKNDTFNAKELVLKCPSKYQEDFKGK